MNINYEYLIGKLLESNSTENGLYDLVAKDKKIKLGRLSFENGAAKCLIGSPEKNFLALCTNNVSLKKALMRYYYFGNDFILYDKEDRNDETDKANKAAGNYFDFDSFTTDSLQSKMWQHICTFRKELVKSFKPEKYADTEDVSYKDAVDYLLGLPFMTELAGKYK